MQGWKKAGEFVKSSIRVDQRLLNQIDRCLAEAGYRNRSQFICAVLREKIERAQTRRLAKEVAKLDPKEERSLAEEGLRQERLERADFD